ncbi:unnamed protein product, partial [Mesorhabditis belari]|uniref:C-type lectin domain-containing protein n=1 Tax=Mesorhabditis belari TaxID=2138241 RepID=A0AAF3J498_9BILA
MHYFVTSANRSSISSVLSVYRFASIILHQILLSWILVVIFAIAYLRPNVLMWMCGICLIATTLNLAILFHLRSHYKQVKGKAQSNAQRKAQRNLQISLLISSIWPMITQGFTAYQVTAALNKSPIPWYINTPCSLLTRCTSFFSIAMPFLFIRAFQGDLNFCYIYTQTPMIWDDAKQYCASNGASLVSIHNAFQNGLLGQLTANLTGSTTIWIGAYVVRSEVFEHEYFSWVWDDDTNWDYDRTKDTNPDQVGYLNSSDGQWYGTDRGDRQPTLCVYAALDPTQPITTLAPGCLPATQQPLYNCRDGWQYSPETGYQYLVAFDKNFTDGEAFCVTQGAHLVSIHSAAENDFVRRLCCTSDGSYLDHIGQRDNAKYLTGGQWSNDQFTWTDGTPWDFNATFCDQGTLVDPLHYTMQVTNWIGSEECNVPSEWWWEVIYEPISDPTTAYVVCKKK